MWEFWESRGILDALTEHRLSALGSFPTRQEEEEEEAERCSVGLSLFVVSFQDILRELTQNNDRFYSTAPSRKPHV